MNWTSFEAFPVQTCALDPKPMQYVRFREGLKRTRLTYYCAHLRSTKESLIFEYLEKEKISFALSLTLLLLLLSLLLLLLLSVYGGTGW